MCAAGSAIMVCGIAWMLAPMPRSLPANLSRSGVTRAEFAAFAPAVGQRGFQTFQEGRRLARCREHDRFAVRLACDRQIDVGSGREVAQRARLVSPKA